MSTKNTLKQSNKSSKHKEGFKRFIPKTKLGWFFIVCGIVVIGLAIYSIIVISNQPKILTKDQAKEFLQKQANGINLPGEVAYEKVEDNGCNTQGLLGETTCKYNLKKYFKNSEKRDENLRLAESAISELGWAKSDTKDERSIESYHYNNENSFCKLYLFDNGKKDYYYDTAQKYLNLNTSPDISDNEYIYGFDCYKQYE